MDEKFSALIDGELDTATATSCLEQLCENESLRAAWSRQHLLKAVLREEAATVHVDLADRVMAALSAEPAGPESMERVRSKLFRLPMPRSNPGQWATGLALAASVAAVAMLLPFTGPDSEDNTGLTGQYSAVGNTMQPSRVARTQRTRANAEASRELEQYLLTHEALAAGHGLSSQRSYMRMASPGTAYVAYSPE